MNIEKEITKYYNEQFEKHKPALIDLLSSFLGEEHRELIKEKVNSLDIIYFVTRRDLSLALNNDDLDENEQKMLENFLEKILNYNPKDLEKKTVEELIAYVEKIYDLLSLTGKELFTATKNTFLLAKEYDCMDTAKEKVLKETLELLIKEAQPISLYHYIIGTYGTPKQLESFKYQNCGLKITYENQEKGVIALPIYPRDLSPDGKFLWAVLNYVINSLKKEDINLWHGSINLGKRLNTRITDYLSIILAHKLHKNGTYIFDNKDLSKIEKKYERLLESEVYQKLKLYFGSLFTKYLIEPNKVIELVGKDNFHQFALWISYLASNLEDEMDYYEEYVEEEDENAVSVPIPDLDIDIMEVLDDMYLEYLRHQTISLTTIDIKTILQAKKVMDAKKEYARIETEHDSKYYHITLLFKYLEKYGNCCIRFSSRDKLCHMLEFKIAENGELKVTKYIEVYDKPLFNEDKFNSDIAIKLFCFIIRLLGGFKNV